MPSEIWEATRQASSSEAARAPSVSHVGESGWMPPMCSVPAVGLKPIAPQ